MNNLSFVHNNYLYILKIHEKFFLIDRVDEEILNLTTRFFSLETQMTMFDIHVKYLEEFLPKVRTFMNGESFILLVLKCYHCQFFKQKKYVYSLYCILYIDFHKYITINELINFRHSRSATDITQNST